MEIEQIITGTSLTVKPKEKLDTITANDFFVIVTKLIDENSIVNLTLDFKEITYISSIGLRVLLELQKKMNILGEMTVINVSSEIMKIINMTGFQNILIIK